MKSHKVIILLLAASFLVPACSKDRSQEEKIRITIDKPDAQRPQEASPRAEVPERKSSTESQQSEVRPKTSKPEPAPEGEPLKPERRDERTARPPAQVRSLDFRHVAEHLDTTKYSRQQIKAYFLSIRGKRVSWAGTVYQVRIGRNGYKILVENRTAPARAGYNIVLVNRGPSNIGHIANGTEIRFSGVIRDVGAARPGSGPVIVLVDTKIQN
ncbi:MAG: hypothetical protein HZB31_10270 [Nitrospirae bacterium]|nr:hypothetical protein [Nitrospirota bacterium]